MAKKDMRVFEGETVTLDGEDRFDCEFRQCHIVYSGSTIKMDGCTFDGCTWELQGPALGGLQLLASIYFMEPNRADAESYLLNSLKRAYGASHGEKPPRAFS